MVVSPARLLCDYGSGASFRATVGWQWAARRGGRDPFLRNCKVVGRHAFALRQLPWVALV